VIILADGSVKHHGGLITPPPQPTRKKVAKSEQALAEMKEGQLPAYLQGKGKTSKIGNIDSTDIIIPRVKLLQAISPEIAESNLPGAKAGVFWHTVANEPLGEVLTGIPIITRKSIVLWSPRNDDRGVLARSSDGVNWDKGYENMEFEVKPKGVPKAFKLNTGPNVKGSFLVDYPDGPSLADFGTSVPGDPQSAPMASLTYNFMWFFPDFPHHSPAIVINTRSAVKPAKLLLSNIEQNPVDHYYRKFLIKTVDLVGDEGPYKGYAYQADGYAEEELGAKCKALYEQFREADWRANEEEDDTASSGTAVGGDVGGKANAF